MLMNSSFDTVWKFISSFETLAAPFGGFCQHPSNARTGCWGLEPFTPFVINRPRYSSSSHRLWLLLCAAAVFINRSFVVDPLPPPQEYAYFLCDRAANASFEPGSRAWSDWQSIFKDLYGGIWDSKKAPEILENSLVSNWGALGKPEFIKFC